MVLALFLTSCDSTGVRVSHHPCNTDSKDRSRSLNDSAARSLALALSDATRVKARANNPTAASLRGCQQGNSIEKPCRMGQDGMPWAMAHAWYHASTK